MSYDLDTVADASGGEDFCTDDWKRLSDLSDSGSLRVVVKGSGYVVDECCCLEGWTRDDAV